jgi:amino acid transporter
MTSPVGGRLERGMDLRHATATNIISMVGVGPFLTIPFMLASMNGPHILYAWVAGALLALADGLVYAQLGAALPGSGGPYLYLLEGYKPFGLGRLMAFAFLFQIILVAPLSIASGAVGFADYLQFYWTTMSPAEHHVVTTLVCLAVTTLLYRDIRSIGRLTVVMLVVVFVTVGWVIVAGLFSFSPAQAFDFPDRAYRLDGSLLSSLGATAILAMYSYGGYNQVCNIAEEVRDPTRTVPRSIVLSILVVAAIYIVMSTVIVGMLPWQEAMNTRTIASIFIQRTFDDPDAGRIAGGVMTALILFVAASSLFALILGYSRILFAAAREGDFFAVFARVHPTKRFPHVAVVTIGLIAIPFSFFTLGQIVSWLIQVQILLQFVWQAGAVVLLSRYRRDIPQPFRMWGYPWPAVVSAALWLYIFTTGPWEGIVFSVGFFALAIGAYGVFRRT